MELFSFDEVYVERLKAEDPLVQQHFVGYFSQLLFVKLRSRALPQHVIDDVRQETFVRVFTALRRGDHGLRAPDRLGAFVNSVCNNVLLEQYRSSGRTEAMEESLDPPDSTIDMDRELISEEAQQQVRQVLEQLSGRDRALLRAVFIEEKNKEQVCKEMGVERDYLRVLLHRAKSQFRSKFHRTFVIPTYT